MPKEYGLQKDEDVLQYELGESDDEPLDELDTNRLVDLYVMSSEVESESDDLRKNISTELQGRVDEEAESDLGTVRKVKRERTSLKDTYTVITELMEGGVRPGEVLSVDKGLVEEAVEQNEYVSTDDVFEVYEQEYIQKTGVNEDEVDAIINKCRNEGSIGEQVQCLTEFTVAE